MFNVGINTNKAYELQIKWREIGLWVRVRQHLGWEPIYGGEVVRRMGVVGVGVSSHSGSYPLKNELMLLEIG